MNILSVNFLQNSSKNVSKLHPAFGASSPNLPAVRKLALFNDIFQKSKGNEIVKKINIKDLSGNDALGVIIKNEAKDCIAFEKCSLYEMYINGIKSGHITFSDEPDENGRIFVYGINTANYENSKNYKGIGTELLKLAVEHSIDEGCGGKIGLFADFIPEPTQFYYKSNLRASPTCDYVEHSKVEGILDFSIRNNLNSDEFEDFPNAVPMALDEKGAKAFLKGERLYKNMNSKTLYQKTLEGENEKIQTYIDFCDFTDRDENPCYLIQAIGKKVTDHILLYRQIGALEIKPASGNDFSECKIGLAYTDTSDAQLNYNIEKELINTAKIMTGFLNIKPTDK